MSDQDIVTPVQNANWANTILPREETPVEVSPAAPVAEPAAEAAPPPATPPGRDFEAELVTKDLELKAMEDRLATMEGASKEEHTKLMVEVARLVNEKTAIERARDEALAKRQAELEEVSQATQTLASKTQTLEQQLATAQAEATTLRVLTQEFPNLLRYARFIPKSSDEAEIRGYCQLFEQTRSADLGEFRQIVTGGAVTANVPTGAPATRAAEPFTDLSQLEERLFDAALNDRNTFEVQLQSAIRQLGLNKAN